MTLAALIREHLREDSGGVDLDDASYEALSQEMAALKIADAGAALLDVIVALGECPASFRLVGVLALLIKRAPRADADALRARAEALLSTSSSSVKAPPTPGSRPVTTSLLAELRKR